MTTIITWTIKTRMTQINWPMSGTQSQESPGNDDMDFNDYNDNNDYNDYDDLDYNDVDDLDYDDYNDYNDHSNLDYEGEAEPRVTR